MNIFYSNPPPKPRVSLILLDWSCRESFHFLHYINEQTVERDQYEIIWIEYYNRRAKGIDDLINKYKKSQKAPCLDQWIAVNMPSTLYYHKHLMYNIGIVRAHGDIVVICDSDSMVRPTFIETIINTFEEDSNIILHMDEVRNNSKGFYPFNYPTFEQVEGKGAINFKNGTTTGITDEIDPLHTRNYGASMAAKREGIIAIGGSDEHIDYLGHICGPYDITFRLRNANKKEMWHPTELLYHVWHPGQAGDNNYLGPHDGRHMSTRALETLKNGRTHPIKENDAIRSLRTQEGLPEETLQTLLIDERYYSEWSHQEVEKLAREATQTNFNNFRYPSLRKLLGQTTYALLSKIKRGLQRLSS